MSTSLISTVLEIEREAETLLAKAGHEAENIVADAYSQRDAAAKAHEESVKKEIASLESLAAAERAKKVRELSAAGEVALAAVRNISDAAFDGGVRHVMKALAGK